MAENFADPSQLDTHSVGGHYVEVEGLPEAGMGCGRGSGAGEAGRVLLAGVRRRRLSDKGIGGGTGTYVVPLATLDTRGMVARSREHQGEERGWRLDAALTLREVRG